MLLLICFLLVSVPCFAEHLEGSDTLLRQEKLKVEPLPDMHTTRAGHSVFYAGGELTVVVDTPPDLCLPPPLNTTATVHGILFPPYIHTTTACR